MDNINLCHHRWSGNKNDDPEHRNCVYCMVRLHDHVRLRNEAMGVPLLVVKRHQNCNCTVNFRQPLPQSSP